MFHARRVGRQRREERGEHERNTQKKERDGEEKRRGKYQESLVSWKVTHSTMTFGQRQVGFSPPSLKISLYLLISP